MFQDTSRSRGTNNTTQSAPLSPALSFSTTSASIISEIDEDDFSMMRVPIGEETSLENSSSNVVSLLSRLLYPSIPAYDKTFSVTPRLNLSKPSVPLLSILALDDFTSINHNKENNNNSNSNIRKIDHSFFRTAKHNEYPGSTQDQDHGNNDHLDPDSMDIESSALSFASCNSRVVTIVRPQPTPLNNNETSDERVNFDGNRECEPVQNENEHREQQDQPSSGSSLGGAIFNFTNCIVGAGAIGLGGAFAESGGIISVVSVVFFAFLVKLSTDLVLEMSLSLSRLRLRQQQQNFPASLSQSILRASDRPFNQILKPATYEELGQAAYGKAGRLIVSWSKVLYAFGCLVAYIKVIQDNFVIALKNMIFGIDNNNAKSLSWILWLLNHSEVTTFIISLFVIFPMCLLRDMTPLANVSLLSVIAMIMIVGIVFHYWINGVEVSNQEEIKEVYRYLHTERTLQESNLLDFDLGAATKSDDFYHHWVEIRWLGYLNNVGTFVFSFVCQHTAHITFLSLKPKLRTMHQWKKVSFAALSLSTLISLCVGVLVYMTFWENAVSDMFQLYPASLLMDLAKLLLSVTMILTFPLPFLTCREVLIELCCPIPSLFSRVSVGSSPRASDNIETIEHIGTGVGDASVWSSTNEQRTPLLSRESRTQSTNDDTHYTFHTAMSQGSINVDNSFTEHENTTMLVTNSLDDTSTQMIDNLDDIRIDTSSIRRTPSNQGFPSVNDEQSVLTADISFLAPRSSFNFLLIPGQDRQLKLPYHIALTVTLWLIATCLAVTAPSLGDILALVGCVSGTLIAFILPGLFAIELYGKLLFLPSVLLFVGGTVGLVGTIYSSRKFMSDVI